MTNATVQNLSWDSNATKQSIEKSAQQSAQTVCGAIDKGISKIGNDIEKNTKEVTTAVKDNAGKIIDAVGRIKTTNAAANENQVVPVSMGLHKIAESTERLARYLHSNPGKLHAVADTAAGVNRQFTDLIDKTREYAEAATKLFSETQESAKLAGWLGGSVPHGGGCNQCFSVNNSFGRVVGDFSEL